MAVQLRSGKELSNNRTEKKEKTEQEEEEETERKNRRSSSELTAETENKVQTEQLGEIVNKSKKRRFTPTHLQFLSHKDFKRQKRRNNFLNSWRCSRR